MPELLLAVPAIAALVAFYLPWLSGRAAFFIKDTTHFFEPLCAFIGASLRQGHLPLWNPYNYCGMSQAAISSPSLFFPPNWLFALLPFSAALACILLLCQFACAVGTYLLIRALGWSCCAAAVAAAAAGFCGYMFSLSSNYTLVATAAWLPFVLYFCMKILRASAAANSIAGCTNVAKHDRMSFYVVGNAIALALMVSAGRPEISGPALLVVAGFCATARAWLKPDGAPSFIMLIKSLLIGLLFAMPTILPSLEWLPWSRRAEGLPPEEILMYSANWYDVLNLFVPGALGHLQLRDNSFSPLVVPGAYIPYYGSVFVGAVIAALALLGITRRGGVRYWGTIALLVVSTVFALGSNMPFMAQLVKVLPGASLLRFPSKLLFFSALSFGLLAARGIRFYLAGTARLAPHLVLWAVLFICCIVGLASGKLFLPFLAVPSLSDALVAQRIILLQCVAQFALVLLTLKAMLLCARHHLRSLGSGIAVAIAFILLILNAFANCRDAAPGGYYKQPSFTEVALRQAGMQPGDRVTALYPERFTVPPSYLSPDPLTSTVKDFQYSRQMLKPFTNIDFQVPSAFGFEGAMVGEYYYFFLNQYVRSSQAVTRLPSQLSKSDLPIYRLLRSTSTHYVITQCVRLQAQAKLEEVPPLDENYFEKVYENRPDNVRLYRVKDPLPRAYLAAGWKSIPRDDLLPMLADDQPAALDSAALTLVETEMPTVGGRYPVTGALVPLLVQQSDPEHLWIDVDLSEPRLLVLQDQYYPGWLARIDENKADILRCNGFMRAVVVPAGKHRVSFTYEPASVWAGLLLALLGVLWCGAIYLMEWNSKVRQPLNE